MALSKEKQEEYNAIVIEYQKFMKDHGASVEAGDKKLLQQMIKLESKKAVFEVLNDVGGKSENVYGNTQRFESSDTSQQYQQKIQLGGPNSGLNPGLVSPKIDLPPPAVVKALKPQSTPEEPKVETKSASIEIDPKTGRKIYKGPKLRSRKVVNGVEHNHDLPEGDEGDE